MDSLPSLQNLDNSADQHHLQSRTFEIVKESSSSSDDQYSTDDRLLINANLNDVDDEYRSRFYNNLQSKTVQKPNGTKNHRVSLGEYFGALSCKEMRTTNYLGSTVEEDFDWDVAELEMEQRKRQGTVVMSSSKRYVSELNFAQNPSEGSQTPKSEQTTMPMTPDSLCSLETDKFHFHSCNENMGKVHSIRDTPKGTNTVTPFIRNMSDTFTKSNNFDVNDSKAIFANFDKNYSYKTFNFSEKGSNHREEPFCKPNNNYEENHGKENNDDNNNLSDISFFKQKSYLFGNKTPRKSVRRNPNMESTRKTFSSTHTSPTSQNCGTISTLTLPNTPSGLTTDESSKIQQALQQAEVLTKPNAESSMPYEVENFLQLALGDEQYSTTMTYANMQDLTYSALNASDLISDDSQTIKNKIQKVMKMPAVDPPKSSKALNRTLTACKTLTQRVKEKFRGKVNQPKPVLKVSIPSHINPNLEAIVEKLLHEADIQQKLIYQSSKALELCKSMREFVASIERVESERFLILASLRRKAALDEISRITTQHNDSSPSCELANLTLHGLSLRLRDDVLRRDRQSGHIIEWFTVVVSEGSKVWATQAFACPLTTSRLYFPEKVTIPGLKPDFQLSISVYSLVLQRIEYNHEDKYHIAKSLGGSRHFKTCPSPKNFLRRSTKKESTLARLHHDFEYSKNKESSFCKCGSLELQLQDLNSSSTKTLHGVPTKSVLHGTIDVKLTCTLQSTSAYAGFLTHCVTVNGLTDWNRRWCVLEDKYLFFWNYPREQEYKKPLHVIDLQNCTSQNVGPIDRILCARPRTLLVETARRTPIETDSIVVECRPTWPVVKNLLSFDNNQDMLDWQSKINYVISTLYQWNMMDSKPNNDGQ